MSPCPGGDAYIYPPSNELAIHPGVGHSETLLSTLCVCHSGAMTMTANIYAALVCFVLRVWLFAPVTLKMVLSGILLVSFVLMEKLKQRTIVQLASNYMATNW